MCRGGFQTLPWSNIERAGFKPTLTAAIQLFKDGLAPGMSSVLHGLAEIRELDLHKRIDPSLITQHPFMRRLSVVPIGRANAIRLADIGQPGT